MEGLEDLLNDPGYCFDKDPISARAAFFTDKAVYVASVAKIKFRLRHLPGAFAAFKERMLQYLQRARDYCWDEHEMAEEYWELSTGGLGRQIGALLEDLLEFRLLFITISDEESGEAPERPNVIDFLDEVKASFASAAYSVAVLGHPSERYDALICFMQEYIDEKMDHGEFLRRGSAICNAPVPNSDLLQRFFTAQFPGWTHSEGRGL